MSEVSRLISLDEFSRHPVDFFEFVVREKETLTVVNNKGERMALKPLVLSKRARKAKTKADYDAFIASAGGWANEDIDEFVKNTYTSRLLSTRPLVEL